MIVGSVKRMLQKKRVSYELDKKAESLLLGFASCVVSIIHVCRMFSFSSWTFIVKILPSWCASYALRVRVSNDDVGFLLYRVAEGRRK